MIQLGGGVIDAELMPDGSVKGAMTVETRYLVLGPIDGEKTREAYNSMISTAKQYGADTLNVDKLLDRIGWHEATKLVRFGHDSNIDKVPPAEAPDGGLPAFDRLDFGPVQAAPAWRRHQRVLKKSSLARFGIVKPGRSLAQDAALATVGMQSWHRRPRHCLRRIPTCADASTASSANNCTRRLSSRRSGSAAVRAIDPEQIAVDR